MRVIDLKDTSLNCYDAFDDSLGASFTITIPGSTAKACFTHSYEYEFSVFVMNDWVVSSGMISSFRSSDVVNANNLKSHISIQYL